MIVAMFKIMWLRLWRDKGALALAFILPGFIFAIFAAIFSNASGGDLDLRVSMARLVESPLNAEFVDRFVKGKQFTISFDENWTADDIRERVRLGQDDVGFVIKADVADPTRPSVTIIKDPGRDVAAQVLKGQIRQTLASLSSADAPNLMDEESALDQDSHGGPSDQSVTYYVGATAILFLLFSAMQGAGIALDERRSGIADRRLIGLSQSLQLLIGKFTFLTLIGTIQALVIVGVAHLFFDVPVWDRAIPLVFACLGSAAFAAAIALLIASLSGSAAQMHTFSTFFVLLVSAIGGSMVPRFMMPDWLQSLAQFTPNYWSIESFYGILARDQSTFDLLPVWGVLFGGTVFCLMGAALISHRLKRV